MIDLTPPAEGAPVRPFPPVGQLFCIGISHRRASFEVRERTALRPTAEQDLTRALRAFPGLGEFFLLCTCNRLELYGVAAGTTEVIQAAAIFGYALGLNGPELVQVSEMWHGPGVVRHLLEVAVGIDSQLVGETEIFGQLKRAYERAQQGGSTGRVLNQLAQRGFHLAKEIRTVTAIGAGHLSLGSQVAEAALARYGDLREANILMLGCGEVGRKVARAFQARGAHHLTLCNRTKARADELAVELDAQVRPYELREDRLGDFDIVVAAAAAERFVVGAAAVEAALLRRAGRPMVLFDLAMPRNIEPQTVAGAMLINLEMLNRDTEASRSGRLEAAAQCRRLIEARSGLLWQRLGGMLAPAVP